jgi:YVTN family beta-propeller protein
MPDRLNSARILSFAVALLGLCLPALPASAQNLYVASASSNLVSIIDMVSNTRSAAIRVGEGPCCVAVTPNGRKLYVSNFRGESVSVIDTATRRVTTTIPDMSAPVGVAVSPNGKIAFIVESGSASVAVVNTATDKVIKTITFDRNHIAGSDGVVFTADGTKAYVSYFTYNAVFEIDTRTYKVTPLRTTEHAGFSYPSGMALTPGGKQIYVANANAAGAWSGITIIETANNALLRIDGASWPTEEVSITPNGKTAYVSTFQGGIGALHIITGVNTATPSGSTKIILMNENSAPCGVAFSPKGTVGYVAEYGMFSAVLAFDVATGKIIHRIPAGEAPCIFGAAVGPKPLAK